MTKLSKDTYLKKSKKKTGEVDFVFAFSGEEALTYLNSKTTKQF